MLSRRLGEWTRVLVDVEDYRGRRERQLREIATRAAEKVRESGKMLQLEPMPALERRWIHLALREQRRRRHAVDRRGAAPSRRDPEAPEPGERSSPRPTSSSESAPSGEPEPIRS